LMAFMYIKATVALVTRTIRLEDAYISPKRTREFKNIHPVLPLSNVCTEGFVSH
jgi:hypothetical protein